MALFKRTNKESVLPEVDKYYEGERRDRTGLAWLLALVSVVIVALILIGVFLAGRWAYREITKDDQVAVVETTEQGTPNFDGESTESDADREAREAAENKEAEEKANREREEAERKEQEEGRVDAPAQTNTPSTPTTGDDPLPSTGPAGIVGVFVTVSTLAGAAHYTLERRKTIR